MNNQGFFQKTVWTICLSGILCVAGCADSDKRESGHFYLPRDSQGSSYQEAVENRHKITKPSLTISKPANAPLEKIVDISKLTPEMPFSEAIDVLRSNEPNLNIVVRWKNLEENGIQRNTPIGIAGVSGFSFRQSLDMLLLAVSPRQPKLAYEVDGNIITIATEDVLHRSVTTKVYGIGDISTSPANFHTNLDELNRNSTATNPSSITTSASTHTASRKSE
jgi:hypothetical protein